MKIIPGKLYELQRGHWMELTETAAWLPEGTLLLGWRVEEDRQSSDWHKFLSPTGTVGWIRTDAVKEINHHDSD